MRSSSFIKISAVALVIAFVALGSSLGVHTGFAQGAATAVATSAAPAAAATTSAAAATLAATAAATYPPCPNPAATMAATSAAPAATLAATAAVNAAATTAATEAGPTATVNPTPGYLGVIAESADTCGARVIQVLSGTPARLAGLQAGDVVVAVDGQALTGVASLRQIVEDHKPGDSITLTIQRSGSQMDVKVQLGTRPAVPVPTMAATVAAPAVVGTLAATAASGGVVSTPAATTNP